MADRSRLLGTRSGDRRCASRSAAGLHAAGPDGGGGHLRARERGVGPGRREARYAVRLPSEGLRRRLPAADLPAIGERVAVRSDRAPRLTYWVDRYTRPLP